MTHMHLAPEEVVPVIRVKLTGFDGRTRVLTGRRDVLWREFMQGDGGPGNELCTKPCGWALWTPLPLSEDKE